MIWPIFGLKFKKQAQIFLTSFFEARGTYFLVNLAREQKSLATPAIRYWRPCEAIRKCT
jgi:hypothetical protein